MQPTRPQRQGRRADFGASSRKATPSTVSATKTPMMCVGCNEASAPSGELNATYAPASRPAAGERAIFAVATPSATAITKPRTTVAPREACSEIAA